MHISFKLNGVIRSFDVNPGMKMLELLRENGFYGVKKGCDDGFCGACTILLDGRAVNSCILLAAQANGREITTIESLGDTINADISHGHTDGQNKADQGATKATNEAYLQYAAVRRRGSNEGMRNYVRLYDNLHIIQRAFVDEGAVQCGYCIPGMILSAKALLDENKNPKEDEIRDALDGNLCRCTGYVKQIKAVKKAAETINDGSSRRE